MVLLAWHRDIAENDLSGEREKIRRGRGERRSLVKPSGVRTIRTSVPRERCRRGGVAGTHRRRLDWPGRELNWPPPQTARRDRGPARKASACKRGNRSDHHASPARTSSQLSTIERRTPANHGDVLRPGR